MNLGRHNADGFREAMKWVVDAKNPKQRGVRTTALYWSISAPAFDHFRTLLEVAADQCVPYRTLLACTRELRVVYGLARSPALMTADEDGAGDDAKEDGADAFERSDEREKHEFGELSAADHVLHIKDAEGFSASDGG